MASTENDTNNLNGSTSPLETNEEWTIISSDENVDEIEEVKPQRVTNPANEDENQSDIEIINEDIGLEDDFFPNFDSNSIFNQISICPLINNEIPRIYTHTPNKRINWRLNLSVLVAVTAVIGLGVGNYLAYENGSMLMPQVMKLINLQDELISCLENKGDEECNLDLKYWKDRWEKLLSESKGLKSIMERIKKEYQEKNKESNAYVKHCSGVSDSESFHKLKWDLLIKHIEQLKLLETYEDVQNHQRISEKNDFSSYEKTKTDKIIENDDKDAKMPQKKSDFTDRFIVHNNDKIYENIYNKDNDEKIIATKKDFLTETDLKEDVLLDMFEKFSKLKKYEELNELLDKIKTKIIPESRDASYLKQDKSNDEDENGNNGNYNANDDNDNDNDSDSDSDGDGDYIYEETNDYIYEKASKKKRDFRTDKFTEDWIKYFSSGLNNFIYSWVKIFKKFKVDDLGLKQSLDEAREIMTSSLDKIFYATKKVGVDNVAKKLMENIISSGKKTQDIMRKLCSKQKKEFKTKLTKWFREATKMAVKYGNKLNQYVGMDGFDIESDVDDEVIKESSWYFKRSEAREEMRKDFNKVIRR